MSATSSESGSPSSLSEKLITPVNVTFKEQPDLPAKLPIIFKISHPVDLDADGQQCIDGTYLIDGLFRGLDLAEAHNEYDVCLMLRKSNIQGLGISGVSADETYFSSGSNDEVVVA